MVQTGDPTGMEQLKHLAFFKIECLQKIYWFVVLFLKKNPAQALVKVEQVYGVANLKMNSVNT